MPTVLAVKFYPPGNDTFALIAYLATFAVGFVVRPFGALVFGRIGDFMGRRIAFIITLTVMGFATAAIGLLPTFKTAGWFSPVILILIRVLQGLALGGEYGGAAVFVAEHVPDSKRGYLHQLYPTHGQLWLLLSLAAIIATQQSMNPAAFQAWGWRLPFLLSIFLVAVSLYVRIRMRESPIFQHLKTTGMTSVTAHGRVRRLDESQASPHLAFRRYGRAGCRLVYGHVLRALYLQTILNLNARTAHIVVAVATACGMPFSRLRRAFRSRSVARRSCWRDAPCRRFLHPDLPRHAGAAGNNVVTVGSVKDRVTGAIRLTPLTTDAAGKLVPAHEADHANLPALAILVWLQVFLGCMTYGPIAAYLVEAFPAKVRYTSLSLPYHIGNGIFGGLLPLIGLSLSVSTGNIYAGLYYPIAVAAVCFICGMFLLKETGGTLIWNEIAPTKTV